MEVNCNQKSNKSTYKNSYRLNYRRFHTYHNIDLLKCSLLKDKSTIYSAIFEGHKFCGSCSDFITIFILRFCLRSRA